MEDEESLSKDHPTVTKDIEISGFSQTLQEAMTSIPNKLSSNSIEQNREISIIRAEPVFSVLNTPDPLAPWKELACSLKKKMRPHGKQSSSLLHFILSGLQGLFPVLTWGRSYDLKSFRSDIMAGLTLASLGIPQSIGYANLAKLEPQYGLYTNLVPPLIYAVMGSSREIAVGPVAVISLLLSSMVQKIVDPSSDPTGYRKTVFTVTFFTGIFQASFGFLRLGFLADFLSRAAIVGFMGGAAMVIGLQQLKGLLGLTHFTNKTDIVSVTKAVWIGLHHSWHLDNFFLGCSFLIFILASRFLGKRNLKLFWLPAIAPLLSVILSTVIVFVTRGDQHGLKIIGEVRGGLNPSSVKQLQFRGAYVGESAKIGVICAVLALTEAVAVGRSFASVRGYQLDGNKEMVSMGCMNIIGSLSSCYVATGSFSRTAVNFIAGCESPMSNIVMAITVFLTLKFLTKLLYYTPVAILASILQALSLELQQSESLRGLMFQVIISFARIMLSSIHPRIEILGRIPGSNIFCNKRQYPVASLVPGLLIFHIGTSFLCFLNANFTKERIGSYVMEDEKLHKDNNEEKIKYVVIEMSNVMNIDSSGIRAVEEIHNSLESLGIQMAIVNPGWQVIHKMKLARLVEKIEVSWIFLTVAEAVEACLSYKEDNYSA
ncbi:low affinity sulfate transporter 3-like [Phalaenopsis equestris]|uniref:low affinity sulfate transporter 3-like n=1 Tax=Phalaenopsis equestris TaxID=78828 RepID=UPI0009E64D16|nr:low affinity sulfate transporter 3-like [Phalaenopsis equestris]